jgi:NAD(P)-dependent dehydrogenase (short-subunit alcohol dehydrogenase family)
MDLGLDGRVAVVTGASKGIGFAVVRTLLEEGARVVAASRNRGAELDAARTGADRDSVVSTVVPKMMRLVTGRLAEPQEIADAVVMLASPRSGSTTGAELVVDSGWIKAS